MRIRFYHATILPMAEHTEENACLLDAELHVDGCRIVYVGTDRPSPDVRFDREIDCQGNLLIPGFKNAHAHGPMTFLRSMADDMPLQEWLQNQVFPAEKKLTPEDTYWLHMLAIAEYVQGGITSSFEMYFLDEGIRRATIDTGFRTVLCGAACGEDTAWPSRMEEDLKKMQRYGNLGDEHLTFQLGFHAEYSTSRNLLEQIAALAERYRVPVFTHCQETERETQACIARYGTSPVQFLASLGMFQYGGGLFHGVCATPEDILCMQKHHIRVITNAGSNAKLASGIAPLQMYRQHGITLGIGTDGPASNNCLDMFWEMHLACVLQKLLTKDAAAMPAEAVFAMAVRENAAIMGLPSCDSLMAGRQADIVMLDSRQPAMQPARHLIKNIVYSASRQTVQLTMVNGIILYENRTFAPCFPMEEIYRKCQEITDRIVQA